MKRGLPDYLFIFSLFFFYSCSQLAGIHKNFMANFEEPVEEESLSRKPASLKASSSVDLEEELAELESQQSDRALDFYQSQKHKFPSTSERIYFLKLPYHERTSYLESRGFLRREEDDDQEVRYGMRLSDLNGSMRKEDVLESWGRPIRVEVAGNPRNENERWLYEINGAMKYVYFEAGYVAGLE